MDFKHPIITDNKQVRQSAPAIDAHFKAARAEIVSFSKTDGVIDDKFVDYCDCPVCGADNHKQLFIQHGFVYCQCDNCTHVFVHNRLKEKIFLELYSKSVVDKLNRQMQSSAHYSDYWSRVYSKYLSYIESRDIKNKNLLDIGSKSILTH